MFKLKTTFTSINYIPLNHQYNNSNAQSNGTLVMGKLELSQLNDKIVSHAPHVKSLNNDLRKLSPTYIEGISNYNSKLRPM